MAYISLFKEYYKVGLQNENKKEILAHELLCDLALRAWSIEREKEKLSGAHLLILQHLDVKKQLKLPYKEAIMDHLSIKKISDSDKNLFKKTKSESKSLFVFAEKKDLMSNKMNEIMSQIENCPDNKFIIVVCLLEENNSFYSLQKILPRDKKEMFSDLQNVVPSNKYNKNQLDINLGQYENLVVDFMLNMCSYCGVKSKKLKRCKRCKISKYCNSECQKKHYKTHKIECHETYID